MANKYEIVLLKNVTEFELRASANIYALIGLAEFINEDDLFFSVENILRQFKNKYSNYIVNVNNSSEIDNWIEWFSTRFFDRLPMLIGMQKVYVSGAINKINSETNSNITESDIKSGVNSSDYSISTDWEKYGQLGRNKTSRREIRIYENIRAIISLSLDLYIEKWIEGFNDLFIFYYS